MLLISISGEWDARKRDELADRLKDAYGATSVVLDLGSSGYITRTFLGVLIHLHRQRMQRRYPPVVLVAGSPLVRQMLGTKILALMPVCATLETGVAAARSGARACNHC
ncbi:MAG: STAS domain-containing protein [Vulcanimicrobiaceae bacterium]